MTPTSLWFRGAVHPALLPALQYLPLAARWRPLHADSDHGDPADKGGCLVSRRGWRRPGWPWPPLRAELDSCRLSLCPEVRPGAKDEARKHRAQAVLSQASIHLSPPCKFLFRAEDCKLNPQTPALPGQLLTMMMMVVVVTIHLCKSALSMFFF